MVGNLFCWQKGRQKTGYDKMLLGGLYWPIKFDCYLLRFPEGSEVSLHTDKVETGNHYRLNIILRNANEGGEFICDSPIYQSKRIKLFRPDVCAHSVTKVLKGCRYVFSIGWIRE